MTNTCELIQQSAQPVLSIRTATAVGNLPQVLGDAYGSIMKYLAEIGESPSGAPFAAYYNMDMQNLDVEIGFPVSKVLPGRDRIKPGEIPAGKYAACLHIGPYSQCEAAYNTLMQWIKEKGYTPTGVAYEFYLNDPSRTPEGELQTRIVFPLA